MIISTSILIRAITSDQGGFATNNEQSKVQREQAIVKLYAHSPTF